MWESRMRFPSLASARRHLQASQAVAAPDNIGGRYCSFLASTAQAMRASLLAKAAPATLRWVRDVSWASHAPDQLDLQSLHRVRERWVMRRTAVINQIRGLLLERGITLRKGRHHVDAALPLILEDADANLSGAVRLLLTQLKLDLDQLSVRIDEADAVIQKTAHENEACRRLVAIPGIGPVTATALIAAIGNGGAFHKGREFAAWMGGGRS